jgi:hypothetical protein
MVLEVFVLLAGIVRVSFIVVIVVTVRWLMFDCGLYLFTNLQY